ncbi:MAG: aldo/keto reductase [Butyricicoccus sp.]|nr:aldo/keto reductase [Butyricicoccus sp.]
MKMITANGGPVGPIGQGTWFLGEHTSTFDYERSALRAGIDAGMNLIDTAEMYGEGAAEKLIGDAIQGYTREDLFLVSKVYPFNAGRNRIFGACEDTLRRMKTDYLDLYLLHWRGSIPLSETVACMEELKAQGRIRNWGVSNFDMNDMQRLFQVPEGSSCATNQVLYHLGSRGIEYDLLPWMQRREMPMMAYCPLAQGGTLRRSLMKSSAVREIAAAHNTTPIQVMLAFTLARSGIVPIPRTSKVEHALENAAAIHLKLSAEELEMLDRAFPPPTEFTPLDVV